MNGSDVSANISFEEFARLVLDSVEATGLDYLVGGAVAVWAYAEPRSTRDFDVVINLLRDIAAILAYLDDHIDWDLSTCGWIGLACALYGTRCGPLWTGCCTQKEDDPWLVSSERCAPSGCAIAARTGA